MNKDLQKKIRSTVLHPLAYAFINLTRQVDSGDYELPGPIKDTDQLTDKLVTDAFKRLEKLIEQNYTPNTEIERRVQEAFKNSTHTNNDGDAKYWSDNGGYNEGASSKFFPQGWFEDKFMPALQRQLAHLEEKEG